MRLDFDTVSETNRSRCNRWHPGFPTDEPSAMEPLPWSAADWSNAVCGEAGEMANVVKKLRRLETHVRGGPGMRDVPPENDRDDLMEKLADEMADVYLYLDLLATYYDIDLPAAIVDKFNRKSEEQGFPERLRLEQEHDLVATCPVHGDMLVTRIDMSRVFAGIGGPMPTLVCRRCVGQASG